MPDIRLGSQQTCYRLNDVNCASIVLLTAHFQGIARAAALHFDRARSYQELAHIDSLSRILSPRSMRSPFFEARYPERLGNLSFHLLTLLVSYRTPFQRAQREYSNHYEKRRFR
jgi:hypothetical protein